MCLSATLQKREAAVQALCVGYALKKDIKHLLFQSRVRLYAPNEMFFGWMVDPGRVVFSVCVCCLVCAAAPANHARCTSILSSDGSPGAEEAYPGKSCCPFVDNIKLGNVGHL